MFLILVRKVHGRRPGCRDGAASSAWAPPTATRQRNGGGTRAGRAFRANGPTKVAWVRSLAASRARGRRARAAGVPHPARPLLRPRRPARNDGPPTAVPCRAPPPRGRRVTATCSPPNREERTHPTPPHQRRARSPSFRRLPRRAGDEGVPSPSTTHHHRCSCLPGRTPTPNFRVVFSFLKRRKSGAGA